MHSAFAFFYLVVSTAAPGPRASCDKEAPVSEAAAALWCHADTSPGSPSAPAESLDARVLAYGPSSSKVLVAQQQAGDNVVLDVLDEAGKSLDKVSLVYKWDRGMTDLLSSPETTALMERHQLAKVVTGELHPSRKHFVAVRLSENATKVTLLQEGNRVELGNWPTRRSVVRVAWDEAGEHVFLSGKAEGAAFVHSEVVPPVTGAIPNDRLLGLLTDEAEHHLEASRPLRASRMALASLEVQNTPKGLFLAAFSHAWLRRHKESAEYLLRLRQDTSKDGIVWLNKAWGISIVRESYYQTLDFSATDGFSFKASKGFEGTSVWVKVKDVGGNTIGVFKPTNGNTYHRGEVFTYQMSKILGTQDLYPVSILVELDQAGCDKFVKALSDVKYTGGKERNRQKLINICKKNGKLEGSFKEWVHGFVFLGAIGTREKLKSHSIIRYLDRKGPQPDGGRVIKVKTSTHLYKPDDCKDATYFGKMNEAQWAQDLSDMLVMDALNANEDRFPGANIEFKAKGEVREASKCVFDFGESRLFSLDNGATFKGAGSNGMVDLTKRLPVTRFNRRTYERLVAISAFVDGKSEAPQFLTVWGIHSVDDLWVYLVLDKGDSHPRRKQPFKLFQQTLNLTLKHMNSVAKDKRAFFQ